MEEHAKRIACPYRIARAYVFTCGVVLMFSMFVSEAVMPELYYDNGPVPPWQERATHVSVSIGYALLLILPYRWSVRGWAYGARFMLLLLASLWLCSRAMSGISGILQGHTHWLIVPASILILGLAILAPGTLFARRNRVGA